MHLMHTMFRVVDPERSVKFYTDALGMTLLRQHDFEEARFSLYFLGYGGERDHSIIELTHNWDTDSYEQGTAYGHIAIQCDDLQQTVERVRQSDGEVAVEPKKMKGGPVMAFAKDPDGYMIELLGPDVFDELDKGFG